MNTDRWISLGSLIVAAASLFYTWWKTRPTSETNLRAINAENRAEEAFQIAKDLEGRDRQRFEREQADLDAPQIAERWVAEIQYKWGAHARHDHYEITKEVKTQAERSAVEILRASTESLHLIGINYDATKQTCKISGWNALGRKRRFGEPGHPPRLGAV